MTDDAQQPSKGTLTITHTHLDGTMLDGSSKGDGVYEIVKQHNFRWMRSIRRIGIRGSRDHHPQLYNIRAAKRELEAAGWTVELDLDDKARATADVEADRDDRLEDRREALLDKADRLGGQAAGRFAAEHAILDMIPPGQPILVGHHSERRHRKDLARAENHLRKGMELEDRAKEAARKAAGSEAWERLRKSGPTTERRIKGLEADRRKIERYMAPCKMSGLRTKEGTDGKVVRCALCYTENLTVADRQIPEHWQGKPNLEWAAQRLEELDDQLGYWRAYLQALIDAEVYKVWGPDDFAKGDWAHYWGGWAEVLRVNKKTLTVPSGYSWTSTVSYDKVDGRRRQADLTGHERAAGYVANIRRMDADQQGYAAAVLTALINGADLPDPADFRNVTAELAEQTVADLRRLLTEGSEVGGGKSGE